MYVYMAADNIFKEGTFCCYDNTLYRFPTKPMLTTKLSFDWDLAAYIHNRTLTSMAT